METITIEQMKEQVRVAEELEELAIKAIKTMDLAILGEYGEMFAHHHSWTLPKNFKKTKNMEIASELYLAHQQEANEAYYQ